MDERQRTVEDLHQAVADLTDSRTVAVERDDNQRDYVAVVSLWDQLADAIENGADKRGQRGGPLAERSPADLDIMELTSLIGATVYLELANRGLKARDDLPGSLRQLAVTIAADEPGEVDWWAYRVDSWCRMAQHYLGVSLEDKSQPRRIRDTPCPHCHIEYVPIETDEGPAQGRPLLLDFVGTTVRAVECVACRKAWFRGEDLWTLGECVSADRYRRFWDPAAAEVDAWVEEVDRAHTAAWLVEVDRCHVVALVEDTAHRIAAQAVA